MKTSAQYVQAIDPQEVEFYIQRARQLRAEALAAFGRDAMRRLRGLYPQVVSPRPQHHQPVA